MSVRVIQGDCRAMLATLPAASVNCIVTSPPYYGLRDYGVEGQIGLEQSPDAYVAEMVAVFREARRVLRDDGTAWINLGDSYAMNTRGAGGKSSVQHKTNKGSVLANRSAKIPPGTKPKDLLMIPARVALALQADGWWLRQDIIWSKPNPMPESVQDRCTKSHEYVFLLSKRGRYWFDADAISEESIRAGEIPRGSRKHTSPAVNDGRIRQGLEVHSLKQVGETRNKRSVWTIATEPSSLAHFAMMPAALAGLCIKAGCPSGGTVLDPFAGAGTTGLVADRLGRNAVLIELNPANAAMAGIRIEGDAGMFAMVAAE